MLKLFLIIITFSFLWLRLGSCQNNDADFLDAGDDTNQAVDNSKQSDDAINDNSEDTQKGQWVVLYREDFENIKISSQQWSPDSYPDDGPFSDKGIYFTNQGIEPPTAYRISENIGNDGWLTIESYSRCETTNFNELASIANDPDGSENQVLRISSPSHTDATIIRSTNSLPGRYKISLKVGYPDFGNGLYGNNGYDGDETALPWLDESSTGENGFYWLAIMDSIPRPHNNVWSHHHRKVVIDSDNNYPPWMEIFNGRDFIESGSFPVMMIAVDGRGQGYETIGKPLISWSAGQWQSTDQLRAADSYKSDRWYQVSIERTNHYYKLTVSGDFVYGGTTSYEATIDYAQNCVWHYNQPDEQISTACIDNNFYPSLDSSYPNWPSNESWPEYFMSGDPHNNFYEGTVYYDDIQLEIWQE